MFSPNDLWKRRLKSHLKETSRYLRLIFNDHLAVVLFFLVAASAFFYQQWLATLSDDFPADWIIAFVLGLLVTRSSIRTLLHEADTVFLLPTEQKMNRYFTNAFWYSFFVQIYILALGFGILTPLYLAVFKDRPAISLLYLGIILIVLKVWNMLSTWWLWRDRDTKSRLADLFIRFILNVSILFLFLQGDAFLYAAALTVIFILLLLYNYYRIGRKGLAWDILIEKEEASMQSFYRIANMFTDVPHVKRRAKKRHFLVRILISSIPFKNDSTYQYLYRITFVRSSDYFGLYIRLLIIGALLLYWVPNVSFKLGFGLLFIYLSGFQLMTLWNHHRTIQWIDIYPISKETRKRELLTFLFALMLFKTFLFGIVLFIFTSWENMLLLWAVGSLFSFLFVQYYAKERLEKRKA